MTTSHRLALFASLAAFALGAGATAAAADGPPASRATVEYDQPLPNVPGKSLRVVRVEYPPGGSSAAHTHAKSAFIFARVLKGSVRSAVNDGPAKVYREGESFQERPGDRHSVSENASRTEPAVLLATFIVDTSDTVLTTPVDHAVH
ncbi:MAG: cupin domain-containing protein [Proteobacteria bacterium]|nr:MAG: cupin domain-containing protein [Pseudomonadota bacterium]